MYMQWRIFKFKEGKLELFSYMIFDSVSRVKKHINNYFAVFFLLSIHPKIVNLLSGNKKNDPLSRS